MTLTHLQKLPKNVRDLDKLIVSKDFKKLSKVQKIAQSGNTGYSVAMCPRQTQTNPKDNGDACTQNFASAKTHSHSLCCVVLKALSCALFLLFLLLLFFLSFVLILSLSYFSFNNHSFNNQFV